MINILIGVCGIGNGHINRQKAVIDALLSCNTNIVIATTLKSKALFNKAYPNIKVVIIHIPWIICGEKGVDFNKTLHYHKTNGIDFFMEFLKFSNEVSACFGNQLPDLVISDYEPNVARYAYAINKPLICMDQQSKFLFTPIDSSITISVEDEISRLRLFFPKVDTRFISSFFKIKCDWPNVIILPPILRKIKRENVDTKKVLVYFSPYSSSTRDFEIILRLISARKDQSFKVFTEMEFFNYSKSDNIEFHQIGNSFDKELLDCSCIISSSGHQLISEAILNEIPLYIFPFSTYEQNYNCNMVQKLGFGEKIKTCNDDEFDAFLSNLDEYKKNMKNYKEMFWKDDWETIFLMEMQRSYGIEW